MSRNRAVLQYSLAKRSEHISFVSSCVPELFLFQQAFNNSRLSLNENCFENQSDYKHTRLLFKFLALNCIPDTVCGLCLDLLVDCIVDKVVAMLIFQSRSRAYTKSALRSGLFYQCVGVCSFLPYIPLCQTGMFLSSFNILSAMIQW